MRDIRLSGTHGVVKKSRFPLIVFVVAELLLAGGTGPLAEETTTAHEDNPPTVVLAIGEYWEPYYSETLPSGGVAVEIVRTAFGRSGYALELHWLPWARAFNMAKKGHYDGVLGAWYTEERTQFFTYTNPFLKTELVFFKKKDKPITYTKLQDLKPYKIGVARDSGPHELLKAEFEQNLEVATSAELNIQKLMWERFDLLADEKLNVLYIIKTQFPEWHDAVEILDPPLQINHLHVIISKKRSDAQDIVDAFNHGLKEIQEDGTFEAIIKEYNFSDKH